MKKGNCLSRKYIFYISKQNSFGGALFENVLKTDIDTKSQYPRAIPEFPKMSVLLVLPTKKYCTDKK